MQSVVVLADERPSLLTELSYILGKEGVRAENMSVESAGGKIAISILVRDGFRAKEVLAKNGFEVVEKNTMVLRIPNYLSKIEKIKSLLSEHKVLVRNMKFIAGNDEKGIVALWVDKPRKAFRILNEFVI